jgi:hypothetical protein
VSLSLLIIIFYTELTKNPILGMIWTYVCVCVKMVMSSYGINFLLFRICCNKIVFFYSSGVCCHHCNQFLPGSVDDLLLHSRKCASAYRPDKSYLYVCCICDYKSYKKSHMRDHIRSHLGEKPFVCENCSSDFSRLRHLKQHISKVHPELI